jgi:hypothetical protein
MPRKPWRILLTRPLRTSDLSVGEADSLKNSGTLRGLDFYILALPPSDESLGYLRFVRSADSRPLHFVNRDPLLANSTNYC